MTFKQRDRIHELLRRLEQLESTEPRPEEAAVLEVAKQAIVDELSRVAREDWLAVYRNGNSLDAVSLAG